MSEETEQKTSRKIRWTSEKIMSISALFVSAISLFALFYQLNLAREENEFDRLLNQEFHLETAYNQLCSLAVLKSNP